MTIKDTIIERYSDEQEVTFADGFDEAIIGFDPYSWRVVYSRETCIDIIMQEDYSYEDALDILFYNTFNTDIGEHTPIFVDDIL